MLPEMTVAGYSGHKYCNHYVHSLSTLIITRGNYNWYKFLN